MRDMPEILFRGKREDNGEWVYGYLYVNEINGATMILNCWESPVEMEVDPSTVGQYTGLTDKNGVKIFEGDIIRTKKYGKIVGHTNVNDFDVFEVQYELCKFRLANKRRGFDLADDRFSKFEVIGNVHNNPELLEGGDEE